MESNEKIPEETIKPTTQETKTQEKNPFENIEGSTYVKLEKDKAKFLLLKHPNVQTIKRFKDEEESKKQGKEVLKEQPEFSAVVLQEDGETVQKVFSTTSYKAVVSLCKIFGKYWPDVNTPRMIRVKKMGEGKNTVWDIEEQPLPKQ